MSVVGKLRRALDYLETPALIRARASGVRVDLVAELIDLERRFGISAGTLLDVGANRGEYSAAARFLNPSIQPILFEPIPELADDLRATWEPEGGRVHNVALTQSAGTQEFFLTSSDDLSSLLPPTETLTELMGSADITESRRIEVQTNRLDALEDLSDAASPVLLKIDVQGAELDVLRGATGQLEHIDCIKLEYNFEPMYAGQVKLPELFGFLHDHGFPRFVQVDLRLLKPTIHCCDFILMRDPA